MASAQWLCKVQTRTSWCLSEGLLCFPAIRLCWPKVCLALCSLCEVSRKGQWESHRWHVHYPVIYGQSNAACSQERAEDQLWIHEGNRTRIRQIVWVSSAKHSCQHYINRNECRCPWCPWWWDHSIRFHLVLQESDGPSDHSQVG